MYQDVWFQLVTCIMLLAQTVSANWDRRCTPFTRSFGPHPHGICGRRIDETLDVLCVGGYNEIPTYGQFRKKRDSMEELHKELMHASLTRKDANSYLLAGENRQLTRHKRSNFYTRGIVCECCYNRCDLMELFSYCKNSPSLFGLFKRSTDRQNRLYPHLYSND